MICKKCGANIPDGFAFCMQCGTKVENKETDSSEENGAISESLALSKTQNSSRKRLYVGAAVSLVLVILVVLGILFSDGDSNAKKGYFAGIPWGTDIDTVQNQIENNFNVFNIARDGNSEIVVELYDYEGMEDVFALGGFKFNYSNGLESVGLFLGPTEGSAYWDKGFSDEIVGRYNKLYGVSEPSGDLWEEYTWEAQESVIAVTVMTENHIYLEVSAKE